MPIRATMEKSLTVNKIVDEDRTPRWHRRPDTRRAEILDGAVLAFGERATSEPPWPTSRSMPASPQAPSPTISAPRPTSSSRSSPSASCPWSRRKRRAWRATGARWALARPVPPPAVGPGVEPGFLELMRVVKVESAEFPESGRVLCQQLGERWRRIFGEILNAGMAGGEFRRMDVDVAARAISYAIVGVAEKVSAFRTFDARMPEREAMWTAVREMVERFVLVRSRSQHTRRPRVRRRDERRARAGGRRRGSAAPARRTRPRRRRRRRKSRW